MGTFIKDTSAQDVVIQRASLLSKSKTYPIAGLALFLIATALYRGIFAGVLSADVIVDRNEVRISEVRIGNLIREVTAQGRIVAANSPTLYSPEVGYIDLKVKPGQNVAQGQLLAIVVSPSLNELLAQEKSRLQQLQVSAERSEIDAKQHRFQLQQIEDIAKVNVNAMEREKRRAEKAIQSNLISQIDYEKAIDDLARAILEYSQAKKNNRLKQESLDFDISAAKLEIENQQLIVNGVERRVQELTILSPVDGMVGNIQVEQRQALKVNQALITVVDMHAFEIEAKIPESYVNEMAPNMAVTIRVNAEKYAGEITSISPEVVNAEVVTRIRFTGETPKNLRQNQRLTSKILLQNKSNVLLLDRGDFFSIFEGTVFRVTGNKAERTYVQLGDSSLQHIEIIKGLEAGDKIIVSRLDVSKSTKEILLSR